MGYSECTSFRANDPNKQHWAAMALVMDILRLLTMYAVLA